jgi:hypothetical protein
VGIYALMSRTDHWDLSINYWWGNWFYHYPKSNCKTIKR